jgi:hypothetical protein
MDLNAEIWKAIESRPKITTDEQKHALHVDIMRLIEKSRTNVGKKLGVTVMTQEGSLAGDKAAQNRREKGAPTDSKPKSI